jgi:hypothetical protein
VLGFSLERAEARGKKSLERASQSKEIKAISSI